MNGEHGILLSEIQELRKEVRDMYGCFISKNTFWKVISGFFAMLSALAGLVIIK